MIIHKVFFFCSENPSPEPQVEVAPLAANVVTVEEPDSEEEVAVAGGVSGDIEAPKTNPIETLAVGKTLLIFCLDTTKKL